MIAAHDAEGLADHLVRVGFVVRELERLEDRPAALAPGGSSFERADAPGDGRRGRIDLGAEHDQLLGTLDHRTRGALAADAGDCAAQRAHGTVELSRQTTPSEHERGTGEREPECRHEQSERAATGRCAPLVGRRGTEVVDHLDGTGRCSVVQLVEVRQLVAQLERIAARPLEGLVDRVDVGRRRPIGRRRSVVGHPRIARSGRRADDGAGIAGAAGELVGTDDGLSDAGGHDREDRGVELVDGGAFVEAGDRRPLEPGLGTGRAERTHEQERGGSHGQGEHDERNGDDRERAIGEAGVPSGDPRRRDGSALRGSAGRGRRHRRGRPGRIGRASCRGVGGSVRTSR